MDWEKASGTKRCEIAVLRAEIACSVTREAFEVMVVVLDPERVDSAIPRVLATRLVTWRDACWRVQELTFWSVDSLLPDVMDLFDMAESLGVFLRVARVVLCLSQRQVLNVDCRQGSNEVARLEAQWDGNMSSAVPTSSTSQPIR